MTEVFDITERLKEINEKRHREEVQQEFEELVQGSADTWSPAEAISLVNKLIEAGEINPEIIIVPYLEKHSDEDGDDKYLLNYFSAGGSRAEIITMLETLKIGMVLSGE